MSESDSKLDPVAASKMWGHVTSRLRLWSLITNITGVLLTILICGVVIRQFVKLPQFWTVTFRGGMLIMIPCFIYSFVLWRRCAARWVRFKQAIEIQRSRYVRWTGTICLSCGYRICTEHRPHEGDLCPECGKALVEETKE